MEIQRILNSPRPHFKDKETEVQGEAAVCGGSRLSDEELTHVF